MKPVFENIRALRKSRNLSQAALARRAGMSPAQLCKIEAGRNGLTGSTLSRLANALDVAVSELLGENRCEEACVDPMLRVAEEPAAVYDVKGDTYTPLLAAAGTEEWRAKVVKRIEDQEDRLRRLEKARGIALQSALQLVYPYGCGEESAELLARDLRASLGLGRQPVAAIDAVLERCGVRVLRIDAPKSFQSASYYNAARRTISIALNIEITPERETYRLAYELGAAVLFASSGYYTVADEGPAHRFLRAFTAAFLMPEETVRAEVALLGIGPGEWTMRSLVFVKERFQVSAEAFALRLESLGLIEPTLRHSLRDALRARYATHPADMEPHPPRSDNLLSVMAAIPSPGRN